MTVSLIIRAYKSTRENGYCESRILQILISQFDSGRGLHYIGCFIILKKVCCFHSSVAQLVEQLTVNQLVAGSSPARGATIQFVQVKQSFLVFVGFFLFDFLIMKKTFCLRKSNLDHLVHLVCF